MKFKIDIEEAKKYVHVPYNMEKDLENEVEVVCESNDFFHKDVGFFSIKVKTENHLTGDDKNYNLWVVPATSIIGYNDDNFKDKFLENLITNLT